MTRRSRSMAIALSVLALLCVAACDDAPRVTGLRLADVGPFAATIEWTTTGPVAATVLYGEGSLLDRAVTETSPATEHRVSLAGLKPSTIYTYRIEGMPAGGSFRSAPGRDGAFDIVLLSPSSPGCREDTPGYEAPPDLAVVAGPCAGELARRPASILTLRFGPDSGRVLRYGGWRIRIASGRARITPAPAADGDDALRKVTLLPSLPDAPPSAGDPLVLAPEGAWHDGTKTIWGAQKPAWFEFDAFEVARVAGEADDRERDVLVEAPPETKKSCLYCDRLLESGRYEQSIAWYEDFIRTNRDRHAVEDAHLSIARIRDEKLFRYAEALADYEAYLRLFPDSRRASLVRYRIDYLKQHAGGGFEPLAEFERAKATMAAADPLPAVNRVERLVSSQPGASIAEDALFWLGHTLEKIEPARAARHYEELIARFPEGGNASMAAIALGDMLYRDKRYLAAIDAYERAESIAPETYRIGLEDKLRKSHRNVFREIARWLSWAVLGAWTLFTAIRRPPLRGRDGLVALALAMVFVAAGGTYLSLHYETAGALAPALAALAAASCAVFFWNRWLSGAVVKDRAVAAHAVTAWLAAAYLVLYSFHYLYPFGL